jgi:predicted HAD superfamily phosphohydrolase YqeG
VVAIEVRSEEQQDAWLILLSQASCQFFVVSEPTSRISLADAQLAINVVQPAGKLLK